MDASKYAIIIVGGKQYRVAENGTVLVDKLAGDAGETVTVADVLYVGGVDNPLWGKPTVEGASVTATIVEQTKAKKIDAFTYKKRKNQHKHWGHRQQMTRLKIGTISTGA